MFVKFFVFILTLLLLYYNKSLSLNNSTCNTYYLRNKKYYDTVNATIFSDNDLRSNFFPNFKRIYPSIPIDDCVLDIGSNIGEITEMFHTYYNTNTIYLAEPLLKNIEITRRNYNLIPQIVAIHTAIGFEKNKKVWKTNYKPGAMMTIARRLTNENISFMNLDDFYYTYAEKKNVFLLKIDVEGYEDEVLFTGKKLLSSGKIKYIYFEYHKVYTLICKTNCSSIVLYLERFGYNCYLIGKYKIIRITRGCFVDINSQKLAHVLGIKDSIKKEKLFVDIYNNYYNINT